MDPTEGLPLLNDVLEGYGLEVNVAHAQHTKILPGRKTGIEYYEAKYRQQQLRWTAKQAASLNTQLVPLPGAGS